MDSMTTSYANSQSFVFLFKKKVPESRRYHYKYASLCVCPDKQMPCGTLNGEQERFSWNNGIDSRKTVSMRDSKLKAAWFSVTPVLCQVWKTTDHPQFLLLGSSQMSELPSQESCLVLASGKDVLWSASAFLFASSHSLQCVLRYEESFLLPDKWPISSLLWNTLVSPDSKTNLLSRYILTITLTSPYKCRT